MHNNTYTVVGISTLNNVVKVRFANDIATRYKVLARNAHTNIVLIECAAMHKLAAAQFALTQEQFANEQAQAVIKAYIAKNTVA
jgi:hypothetical protein